MPRATSRKVRSFPRKTCTVSNPNKLVPDKFVAATCEAPHPQNACGAAKCACLQTCTDGAGQTAVQTHHPLPFLCYFNCGFVVAVWPVHERLQQCPSVAVLHDNMGEIVAWFSLEGAQHLCAHTKP